MEFIQVMMKSFIYEIYNWQFFINKYIRKCIEGPKQVINAAYNGKAVADVKIEKKDLNDVSEYGYGYWLRFMSRFPVPLTRGKDAPWYFVSRLTVNDQYTNMAYGDRLLSVF